MINTKYTKYVESIQLKAPSDQEIEEGEKLLKDDVNPDWDYKTGGYFIIDVSGKYQVYYTLWRFKPTISVHVSELTFITNLSTDFLTAINKAKKICGRTPIVIDMEQRLGCFKPQRNKFSNLENIVGNMLVMYMQKTLSILFGYGIRTKNMIQIYLFLKK